MEEKLTIEPGIPLIDKPVGLPSMPSTLVNAQGLRYVMGVDF
jgi:hypothetical protein